MNGNNYKKISPFDIPREPLYKGEFPSTRSWRFRLISSTKAELRRSISERVNASLILLIGLFALVQNLYHPFHHSGLFYAYWIAILVFAISFITIGVIGLILGYDIRQIILDKQLDKIIIKPGASGFWSSPSEYTLEDIIGIQLCQNRVSKGIFHENRFEINFVFFYEVPFRLNIAVYTKRSITDKVAKDLTDFLQLPLFNHTLSCQE
jgi:hypothetical protein